MYRILLTFALAGLLLAGCTSVIPEPGATHSFRLPDYPVAHAEELLQAYPGVRLIHNGGGFEVRIRGARREPLYVVDGIALIPHPPHTLRGLNPGDIAQIEVLKEASATASYGMRGAAGVVLITTRRNKP